MNNVSDKLRAHYLRCLHKYNDPPRGVDDRRTVEIDLADAEHDLLAHPPLHRNDAGVWLPRAKGLITADEARAGASVDGLRELEWLDAVKAPRVRDDFKLIPEREWDDALQQKKRDEAMNRPLSPFRLDQDGVGSCAAEGTANGLMFTEAKQGQEVEELNPYGLYHYSSGGRDQGSSLSDNISLARSRGCPSARVWPRSKGFRANLSDEAKQDALRHRLDEMWRVTDKQELGTALLMSMVCLAGYSGHAWLAVDLLDRSRITWENSWGEDWGDQGFSTLKFSSIQWSYGVWAFRTVRRAG